MTGDRSGSPTATEPVPSPSPQRITVIEAAWLQAAVVLPLLFHVLSFRVFEPEKAAALRLLGAIALAGLAVAAATRTGRDSIALSRLRSPLCVVAAGVLAVTWLSTAFSIDPWRSLFGSYYRQGGALTLSAQVALFAAVAVGLRHSAQLERLFSAITLAGVFAASYALVQRIGLDPLSWDAASWGGDPIARTPGTIGNPTFLGGYLAVSICATAPYVRARPWPAAAALIIQGAGIWATGSRGPLIAAAAGAVMLAIALAAAHGARRIAVATLGIGIAVAGFVVLLNVPQGPFEAIRDAGPWRRVAHVLESTDETSRVRLLIWTAAHEAMTRPQALETVGGTTDRFHWARRVIDYGPETLQATVARAYPPELGRLERPGAVADRAHNDLVDAVATGGFLSLALAVALMAAVLLTGFRAVQVPRVAEIGGWCAAAGGVIVAVAAGLFAGRDWLIVPAMGTSALAGVTATLAVLGSRPSADQAPGSPKTMFIAALMAGAAAHLVDTQIGVATIASRTLFWLMAGCLVALAARGRGAMAVEDRASSDRAIPTWLVGTAVATLGLAFAPAMGIAAAAWHGTAVLLAIAATVLLVARTSAMLQWQQAGTALASGALMVGLFVTIVRLVAVVGPPEGSDIVRRVSMLAAPIAAYFAVLAATVVIGGGTWNGRRARVSTTAAALTAVVVFWPVLAPVRADVLVRAARELETRGYPAAAIPLHEAASRLVPYEIQYQMAAAGAAHAAALGQSDARARDALFGRSAAALESDVTRQFDLQQAFAAARLYHAWAAAAGESRVRIQRGAQANALYQRLAALSPTNPLYWNDWAALALDVFGNPRLARTRLDRSMTLDPYRSDTSKQDRAKRDPLPG